jgi:hypothetical protein
MKGKTMTTSRTFDLRHWSSGKFIHPRGGTAYKDVGLVTYPGTGPQTKYYLEFREGPWGYLVWAKDPKYSVHPSGGAVDAGNGTSLVFHSDRHPGAYFAFNEENRQIVHISGRFCHPLGGSAQPGNNNGIVLYDGYRDATRFYATDGSDRQVNLDLPAQVSVGWRLVFAEDDPLTSRKQTFRVRVGQTVSKQTTKEAALTLSVGMEFKLFGTKTSAQLQLAYKLTNSETWTYETERSVTYDIVAGQPVAVWQRVFRAQFPEGSLWEYGSGNVFRDTRSSNTPPTG